MPELPEVETMCRGLAGIVGRRIERATFPRGRVRPLLVEPARPVVARRLAGAEILGNPSASWFTIGKHRVRRGLVEQVSREDKCLYLYSSLLGCDATRLVFDATGS